MLPLIPADTLPAPRLELRWRREGDDWSVAWCDYQLVLPLRDGDLRREWTGTDTLTLRITTTRRTSPGPASDQHPVSRAGIDVPYRDAAHAEWDAAALHGVPVFVVCDDQAERL